MAAAEEASTTESDSDALTHDDPEALTHAEMAWMAFAMHYAATMALSCLQLDDALARLKPSGNRDAVDDLAQAYRAVAKVPYARYPRRALRGAYICRLCLRIGIEDRALFMKRCSEHYGRVFDDLRAQLLNAYQRLYGHFAGAWQSYTSAKKKSSKRAARTSSRKQKKLRKQEERTMF